MKKAEIEVGKTYIMKVSGRLVPVKITGAVERVTRTIANPRFLIARKYVSGGGWTGINLKTNREVRIKSAAKLRSEVTA